jgi:L,D-transpeptidase YcbB
MWRSLRISLILFLLVTPFRHLGNSLQQRDDWRCATAANTPLCLLIESSAISPLQHSADIQELRQFYRSGNYTLAWFQGNRPTPQARAVIQILQNADREGLAPDDYGATRWRDLLVQLSQPEGARNNDLAPLDVELTLSVLKYASHLCCGRVDPRLLDFHLGVQNRPVHLAEFMRNQVIRAQNLDDVFQTIEPPYAGYRRTKAALQQYLDLAKDGEGERLPKLAKTIRPGDPFSGLQVLEQRLRRLGDLATNAPIDPSADHYEGLAVRAVEQFQRRHGLNADGTIDAATYNQLKVPLKYRVKQLQLTLERWRWIPVDLPSRLIAVNIPESVLRAYDDHHPSLSMRVIVGKAFHDRQTPVFQDSMEYLIFRPYWNVPAKIVREELIPSIKKNSAFLGAHHFEVVDLQGRPVLQQSVSTAMLQDLRDGKLRVRQKPGPDNSLGLIKFVFPNYYDVYLHGTPEQQLFSRARRDFSHGCIRVEDPEALAEWVLKKDQSWDRSRIESAVNGNTTISVTLSQPIPVLILYGTAFVEENGKVLFFQDIYGFDSRLEQALSRRSSSPRPE